MTRSNKQLQLILETIQENQRMGQSIALCCFNTEENRKLVDHLFLDAEHICLLETKDELCLKKTIETLNRLKPDFLIVFKDEELVESTEQLYEWGGKHCVVSDTIKTKSREIHSKVIEVNSEVIFKFNGELIHYRDDYIKKVNAYWDGLKSKGKTFYDGGMYSVTNCVNQDHRIIVEFGKTTYRYMIYTKEHDFRNEHHTCTTASIALIETSDGYSVLGKMSEESAFSNQVKCLGGALYETDFDNGLVNMKRYFSRELEEELGITLSDWTNGDFEEKKWLLVREKMAFIGVCNVIKLNLNKEELLERFKNHRDKDDEKEVDYLLFIKSYDELMMLDKDVKADYVDELYACYFGVKQGIAWEDFSK